MTDKTTTQRIANQLVALCNAGRPEEAVKTLYADDVVSIEAADAPQLPARIEGFAAVLEKNQWWTANHEVHEMAAQGPFLGLNEGTFAVHFHLDATANDGERTQLREIGFYEMRGDKIAKEQFLYLHDLHDLHA